MLSILHQMNRQFANHTEIWINSYLNLSFTFIIQAINMYKKVVFLCLVSLSCILNYSFALLPIEHWKTNEGAKVYFIYAKEIPMLDIQIAIDAGAFREKNQYGLASLTADLITMGADDLDEESFALALENIGSSIDATSRNDTTIFSIRTLNDFNTLNTTLSLLKKALTKPRFESAILKREIDALLVGLEGVAEDPNALANEAFMTALYPNNRLSVTSQQLKTSIPKIISSDLMNFFKTYYHANNAVIVLVGDIPLEQARLISQDISQTLGASDIEKLQYNFKAGNAQTIHVPFKSTQSTVLLGHVSIDRFNPDYLTLALGNHILGGSGLNSILSQEIREKRGLTYGVNSGFSPGRYQGPFSIDFATKNASVIEGIEAARSVLDNFIKNGPSEAELVLAKNNIIGGFALNLDSNRKLASALLALGIYDLPLDFYDTYQQKIQSISASDIQKAFSKHVHPDLLNTIIVGPHEK